MVDPFEELYVTYKAIIYQYLYHLSSNYHTAEELTHDTFLKAFRSYRSFRGDSSIKTWLFTIARNTYLNAVQKKSHQLEQQMDLQIHEFIDQKDDFTRTNERMHIQEIMNRLPETYRTLLLLRETYGLSYVEISNVIGETEGYVKINLHRARKLFKQHYGAGKKGESR